MCGIIGYTGRRQAAPILLEGLSTLEYRGYDSAGIGVVTPDGRVRLDKKTGKLANLRSSLNGALPEGSTGIGHTRWATHGGPTESNAHPHTGCGGDVVAVHNGIVENYRELKSDLESAGHEFSSQTDSECIPHLIEDFLKRGFSLEEATRMAAGKLRGANATAVFSTREPGRIVAFRLGNAGGIIVGRTEDGGLLSSDLSALLPHTRDVIYLSGGEMASIGSEETTFSSIDGSPIEKKVTRIPFDAQSAEKGRFQHFMHKEIHDQPESVINTLRGRVSFEDGTVRLPELNLTDQDIAGNTACGVHRHGNEPPRCDAGQVLGREPRQDTLRVRQLVRVQVQEPGVRPGDAGGVGMPVGRDGRHPGGNGASGEQGRASDHPLQLRGHADDAHRGDDYTAASRIRGGGGRVQDLYVLAGGAISAGSRPRYAARRAGRGGDESDRRGPRAAA